MKEYLVKEAPNAKQAQEIMNAMAKEGWRVIATSYWMNFKTLLIITFEREV